jgi:hypothetical protein
VRGAVQHGHGWSLRDLGLGGLGRLGLIDVAMGAPGRRSVGGALPFMSNVSGHHLVVLRVAVLPFSTCSSLEHRTGMSGRRPWKVGVFLVGGHARGSDDGWLHQSCGRRGADEPSGVLVVRLLRGRQSLHYVD